MATKIKILQLYKLMLRECSKLPAYNFREYAVRRTRDAFKQNKFCSESEVKTNFEEALKNLEIIKRQAIIGQLYNSEKLVIEHSPKQ